jgi:hypothetical protein
MKKKETKNLFPYSMFPVRLEHMEGKDKKICFFMDDTHMSKYVKKSKLKKKDYKVFHKSEKS